MRALLVLTLVSLAGGLAGLGCAGSGPPAEAAIPAPSVAALSAYAAGVGTLVEVYGSDFPALRVGKTRVVFRGDFDAADGLTYPVDRAFDTNRMDPGTLRWGTFGPYQVPFGPGDQPGVFYGTVAARIVTPTGATIDQEQPLPIVFEVTPSLIVHELQPLSASCGGPVQRALGGAPYSLRVEAIGFTPETFTYTVSAPALTTFIPVSIRHAARGRVDTVGDFGDFIFPEVPAEVLSYGAVLTVQAADSGGQLFQSAFAIAVHRPLEFYYNGNVQVAEVLAPLPTSACIPGGINGRDASYTETMSETRARSYGVAWNETWLASHTVASGTTSTVGLSELNGVGFATTDGTDFRWNLGGEVGGTVGLAKLVEIGMKTRFGIEMGTSRQVQNSQSRESGLNASSTTTDTESATRSMGGMTGTTFDWSISSTDTIGRSFTGHVIARTFGVFYRQTLRLVRGGLLVAYNQCGAASVVGDVDFVDWTWSPDLALGSACPPFPRSNLPPAECIIAPCLGE